MKKKTSLLLAFITVLSFNSFGKTKEAYVDYIKLAENMEFRFEASSLNSSKGFNKSLVGDNYSIVLDGDSAKGHLAYIGKVYSPSFGASGGVVFDNEIFDIKFKYKTKRGVEHLYLTFKVMGESETFNISMTLTEGGAAWVGVRSNNRQLCNYDGKIYPIEDRI